jgi:hypothetical protein
MFCFVLELCCFVNECADGFCGRDDMRALASRWRLAIGNPQRAMHSKSKTSQDAFLFRLFSKMFIFLGKQNADPVLQDRRLKNTEVFFYYFGMRTST